MILNRTQYRDGRSRKGFTLVELMVVIILMSVVSASVIPAMSNIVSMREGAARDDLVRMIEVAKGRSMASGLPHGLKIDVANSIITLVQITQGGQIESEIDPLTTKVRLMNLSDLYPGVPLASFEQGSSDGVQDIIWFDYESSPHVRSNQGAFVSLNNRSAIVTLSSGERVIIYPHSGVLEVQR